MPQPNSVRRKTLRPYESWEPQVSQLRSLVREGHSAREIATRLGRHRGSVASKCAQLGLRLCGGRKE